MIENTNENCSPFHIHPIFEHPLPSLVAAPLRSTYKSSLIVNDRTSTVKNYRGIALSSLLSKIFDNSIISLQESCLRTDDLQFAYKSKTSTVQCISTITEIINYYIKNSSNVYMCTLDCTKAFDRASLVLLFTKLREKK